MKKVLLVIVLVITLILGIAGIIATLVGFFQGFNYVLNFKILNEYGLSQFGKGHVWGSILLFVIGLAMAYFGISTFKKLRNKKAKP